MNENLVCIKTMLFAEEKGFDTSKLPYRDSKTFELVKNVEGRLKYFDGSLKDANMCKIPTREQLRSWLWETYNIWIEISLWGDGIGFVGMIKQVKDLDDDGSKYVVAHTTFGGISSNDPDQLVETGIVESFRYI